MPAATTWSSIDARAPLPTATIVTTAPTPIVMPTSVSADRSGLRRSVLRREMERSPTALVTTRPRDTGAGSCSSSSLAQRAKRVRRIRHDAAVAEADDARAVLGDLVLVRDDDDRDAAIALQLLKDLHHLDARPRVEISRRLVGEQDRRLASSARARSRRAAAGRRTADSGDGAPRSASPTDGERRQRLLPALGRRALVAVVEQRQLDVLDGRGARQQVEALEHEPDRRVPDARQLVLRQLRHVATVQARSGRSSACRGSRGCA